jgi:hypothetical protein
VPARRAVLSLSEPSDVPAAWVAELARGEDLTAAAVDALALRLGRDPLEFRTAWRAKTAADRARFWDGVHPDPPTPILQTLADLADIDGSAAAAVMQSVQAADPYPALRDLTALVSAAPCPAVLFVPPGATAPATWLADIAAGATAWVTGVPAVPTALAVPPAAWAAYLSAAPESRAKAVLREGEIQVPVHDPADVARVLAGAGLGPEAAPTAAVLAADGATDELVAAAVEMIRANVAPAADPQADDRARSSAERFLFELLESIPDTAGRFELNGTLDFRFGPRPAEVDLLARADRVAVEVDGYFHFRGPADYRRDRDKDYELQRRGYLVLRFLADDVVRRVEHVRDRIREALNPVPREVPP